MSRTKLANIKALTFYEGELTASRRTSSIPQLVCVGKPCKYYHPEVVRCTNIGGDGTDVDWKCEADLPEALRFGKVQVSCEGWSGPGDPYVLKDSCGLEYRLVEVPKNLRSNVDSHDTPRKAMDIPTIMFYILWVAVALFILYTFVRSCLDNRGRPHVQESRNNRPGGGSGPSGWFPGGHDDYTAGDPPPPYSKNSQPNQPSGEGWRPGFWTGALVGGLADRFFLNNNNRREQLNTDPRTQRRQWDWEQPLRPTSFFGSSSRRAWTSNSDDREEGPSDLGNVRRSSGFGGSSVR